MKTDDLVALLARNAAPVPAHPVGRRFAWGLAWGTLGAALLMLAGLGLRADLAEAAHLPMFWVKFAVPGALALAALRAAERLARPGARLGHVGVAIALPLLLLWALGAGVLAQAAPEQRVALLLGETWKVCAVLIGLVSLPVFVAAFWVMKGLAPTRLTLAGAAAGLLAGAIGALVYAFHCPEMQAPFLATWYVLGMALPTGVGAALGHWLLRW